jgi:hypothetical protein
MSKAKGKKDAEPVKVEPEIFTGKGEFVLPDNSTYNGDWKEVNGRKTRDGQGIHNIGQEKYVGSWVDDKMSGYGEYYFPSGAVYKGNFQNNLFNGEGTYTFPDGCIYEGNWLNNKMNGYGSYTDSNGVTFRGEFASGMFDSGKGYVPVRG